MKTDLISTGSNLEYSLLAFHADIQSVALEKGRVKVSVNFLIHHTFVEHADKGVKLYCVEKDENSKSFVADLARENSNQTGICVRFFSHNTFELEQRQNLDVYTLFKVTPVAFTSSGAEQVACWRCYVSIFMRYVSPQSPMYTPFSDTPEAPLKLWQKQTQILEFSTSSQFF